MVGWTWSEGDLEWGFVSFRMRAGFEGGRRLGRLVVGAESSWSWGAELACRLPVSMALAFGGF